MNLIKDQIQGDADALLLYRGLVEKLEFAIPLGLFEVEVKIVLDGYFAALSRVLFAVINTRLDIEVGLKNRLPVQGVPAKRIKLSGHSIQPY